MSSGQERRKAKRRPVLDSFAFFLMVPRLGETRLKIHDLSDHGLLFNSDLELPSGEVIDAHLYLNQSLYLPVTLKVVRSEKSKEDETLRLGAELQDQKSKSYKAFLNLLQMLDSIVEAAHIKA